ncbi:helix-turn-helix transcriptional regulator [Streptomyces sp. ME02-6978a]|uniref:helix-turn-helix domain-containing protein n=1 Tax=unclassified Streptomyces TaxID=2593676 RepID=UPI0029B9852F|nr:MULTISPECIES: helix-turn-helix transcriptional regulator [unclassified Streptomyces]MDX3091550.1 helix-turn-helix transcriptional regulator [Streptomyces sp. ME12-02E]MDX3335038.1 helix-turn-helix transcriptional regulator [Streptomyces sp. ME02-6978a]
MSATDHQSGREALGARLRELRAEAGLQGKELADRLGWQRSKVSRLENGKQTATAADLHAWAQALGVPAESADLLSRLRGLKSRQRSWRRQLATGHRAVQDRYVAAYRRTETVRGYEATVVPGLFQTPSYARHLLLLNADLMQSPRDTDEAVTARMRRQEVLYEDGHSFRVLIWEGTLHARVGPDDVMAGQHDRLIGLIGMPQVTLGIVPFGARLKLSPKHGFWIFDEERVVVETINSEFILESTEDLALYARVWDRLDATAVYGEQARRLIGRARSTLNLH